MHQGSRGSNADIARYEMRRSEMVRAIGPDTAMIWPPIGRSAAAVALKFGARPRLRRRPWMPQA